MNPLRGRVLYVSYEFPAITETFVRREFRELHDLGIDVRAVALRPPSDPAGLGEDAQLMDKCLYLGQVGLVRGVRSLVLALLRHPMRGSSAVWLLLTGRTKPIRRWWSYAAHLLTAAVAVESIDMTETDFIHAHFAAGPASIAMFMSVLSGVPFGVTAHAYDLYAEQIALAHKLRRAAVFVTISEFNRRWLISEFGRIAEAVGVVRMGVDLDEFAMEARSEVVAGRIVSAGRLEEKKGHDTLIRACSELRRRGVEYQCAILGAGSLRVELQALVCSLGLQDEVELVGSCSVSAVRDALRTASVSALACKVAKNGDMDGIPVFLMESLALGVPVVSTTVSGIPELVDDRVGVLVSPDCPSELADALQLLLTHGTVAFQLGAAGRMRVQDEFDSKVNARRFASMVLDVVSRRRSAVPAARRSC